MGKKTFQPFDWLKVQSVKIDDLLIATATTTVKTRLMREN